MPQQIADTRTYYAGKHTVTGIDMEDQFGRSSL